jgi:hypothetical protein
VVGYWRFEAGVEFWLDHPGDDHQAILWGRRDSWDANRFHLWVNPNSTFAADCRTPDGTIHTIGFSIPFAPNVWTHFAIVRSGNTYHAYRNGEFASSVTDASPGLPTSVGWRLSSRETFEYNGLVDELRMSEGALPPEQFLCSR